MKTFEDNFKTKDGLSLYWRGWECEQDAKGMICLVHGLGEHCNRYGHVASFFNQHEINFYAFDLRGHGKSEGTRGDTPSYDALMDDIQLFLEHAETRGSALPVFLYGHSLGGNLVLNYLLRRQPKVKGAVISAPALGLAFEPPKAKLLLGRLLSIVLPSMAIASDLETKALSHDKAVVEAYEKDPLVHDRLTGRLFFGFRDAGDWALEHAADLDVPTLLMHGSEDRLTSVEASRKFAKKAGSICEFVLWENFFHELHNEVNKDEVFDYVLKWIENLLK